MEPLSEFYGNGTTLPVIHPDSAINQGILIGELCAKLDTARIALAKALEMNVITPAAVPMKHHVRWALDETHPNTLHEQHRHCGCCTPLECKKPGTSRRPPNDSF